MPGGGAPMVQAGGRGPIGQTRNPTTVIIIALFTCGLYSSYQTFLALGELKAYRGKDDINPIVATLLWLFLCWGMPAKVLEAKQQAGIPNPQVSSPILYLIYGYGLIKDLNEVWAASGGGQPQQY